MIDELGWLDATGAAGIIANGVVSPEEVLAATIARIEARNPAVNAVVTPLFDAARDQLGTAAGAGPFGGVPFLVKDLVCEVAGVPLQEGMRYLRRVGYRPDEDQKLFRRARWSQRLVADGR